MKIGARIANFIAAFSGLFFCLELLAQTAPQTTSVNADNAFDLQAHRGGLGLVVESSLQGFANALELGVSTLDCGSQRQQAYPGQRLEPDMKPLLCELDQGAF